MMPSLLRRVGLLVLLAPLVLGACTDQAFVAGLDDAPLNEPAEDGVRFRNEPALGRAVQPAPERGGTTDLRVGVVVGLRGGPTAYTARKFFGRNRLAQTHTYEAVFNGFAATVAADEWAGLRAELLAAPDVLWFEPDVVLGADDALRAALGLASGAQTTADALGALERLLLDAPAGSPVLLPLASDAPSALRQAATIAAARGLVVSAG